MLQMLILSTFIVIRQCNKGIDMLTNNMLRCLFLTESKIALLFMPETLPTYQSPGIIQSNPVTVRANHKIKFSMLMLMKVKLS